MRCYWNQRSFAQLQTQTCADAMVSEGTHLAEADCVDEAHERVRERKYECWRHEDQHCLGFADHPISGDRSFIPWVGCSMSCTHRDTAPILPR